MTIVDEKEILEIEKLKADLSKIIHDSSLDMKRFDIELSKNDLDMKRFDIELSKKHYEAWRLAFYGVAVGAGGTFAIAKTLQILQSV